MTRARDLSRFVVTSGTTANRPSSPAQGQLYYDTTLGQLLNYQTTTNAWVTVGVGVVASITGGTLTSDATYYYRTFTTTGSLVVSNASLTTDILVVAGGGSGGNVGGGGGGAGGLLNFASQSLSIGSYAVTVGAGGAGSGAPGATGNNGSDSQFGLLTLVKGGGFGGRNGSVDIGGTGGSGGGSIAGTNGTVAGGLATSGQGNNGGTG